MLHSSSTAGRKAGRKLRAACICLSRPKECSMKSPRHVHSPDTRRRAAASLRFLTRLAAVAATGATVVIGIVVAKEHPGASASGSAPLQTPSTSTTVAPTTTTTPPTTTPTSSDLGAGSSSPTTTTTSPPTTTTTVATYHHDDSAGCDVGRHTGDERHPSWHRPDGVHHRAILPSPGNDRHGRRHGCSERGRGGASLADRGGSDRSGLQPVPSRLRACLLPRQRWTDRRGVPTSLRGTGRRVQGRRENPRRG